MPETKLVEITQAQLWELLLHGAIYEEENDTERHVALRCEVDGTLRTFSLQVGLGADGLEHVFLVDTEGIEWVRPYEGYLQVDRVLLTNAEATILNPAALWGATAAQTYAVEFNATNIDTVNNVWLYIGIKIGGVGALAADEHIFTALNIPVRGQTGWKGPYIIAGDDVIRGRAIANNDIVVFWRVRQVDAGA